MNKTSDKKEAKEPDDSAGIIIQDHLRIKDKETDKELVNKRS